MTKRYFDRSGLEIKEGDVLEVHYTHAFADGKIRGFKIVYRSGYTLRAAHATSIGKHGFSKKSSYDLGYGHNPKDKIIRRVDSRIVESQTGLGQKDRLWLSGRIGKQKDKGNVFKNWR